MVASMERARRYKTSRERSVQPVIEILPDIAFVAILVIAGAAMWLDEDDLP
jgi:hypothetical protein